jgi:hypothetical protein
MCKPWFPSPALQNIPKASWVWEHIPVIPALKRLRQEDHKFEASLGYTVRPCLKRASKIKGF